jgi:hypothetical protein
MTPEWTTPMLVDETADEATSCPRWCDRAGHHGWEATAVTGHPTRIHEKSFGLLTIVMEETIDIAGITVSTPVVLWFGPAEGRRLHPGDAARLAGDITAAFAFIGSITP